MVDEESLKRNRNATPQFIGALTETVWTQIGKPMNIFSSTFSRFHTHTPSFSLSQPRSSLGGGFWRRITQTAKDVLPPFAENVAIDLESFANHAGRSTITTDDVLLLARKNVDLQQVLKEFVDDMKVGREEGKAKGKGKGKDAAK